MKIERAIKCRFCSGIGFTTHTTGIDDPQDCSKCNGTGQEIYFVDEHGTTIAEGDDHGVTSKD